MLRHDRAVQRLAMCLAGLAGFVDAVGFLQTRGFFVSFMSGNSTRFGVGISSNIANAGVAAALIGSFVSGVALGSLTGHAARHRRRPAVLAFVAALLAAAALLDAAGLVRAAVLAMAMAMGAENAVFEQDGEIRIGLTYMTGTLVKLGQRLAVALRGGDATGWAAYLMLWLGLCGGAVAGAVAHARLGLAALWIAAATAALLAVAAVLIDTVPRLRAGRRAGR